MGHEELVGHLIGSAERRREEILARARDEADALLARARARADEEETASREALAGAVGREREIRMSRARHEAHATERRARSALVDEIVGRLRQRLSRLPDEPCYPRIVLALCREILPEIPEGIAVLHADARGREVLGAAVSDARIRLAPLPEEELGGVSASDEGGTMLVRNTLQARLDNALPALLVEIRRSLEAPDG